MGWRGLAGRTLGIAAIVFGICFAGLGRLAAQSFQIVANGLAMQSAPIQGIDGRLYGTTSAGGANNAGFIFAINTDGTGLQNLHSFPPGVTEIPYSGASLIQGADGRLYGTTEGDASAPNGGVFAVNTDGTGFALLHAFSGSDGADPQYGLIQGTDGRLYGTTWGGVFGNPTIFALEPDGTGFTTICTLPGYEGTNSPVIFNNTYPSGVIEGSDGRLYGTTQSGGTYTDGTLFALNRDGTGFTILHNFGASGDGGTPGPVIQGRDGRIYGPTQQGAANGLGSLFAINDDGSNYATLCSFVGSAPLAIIQATDGRLYGVSKIAYLTADYGGATALPEFGTLFSVQTDGTGFVTLYSSSNFFPATSLLQASNGQFYGGDVSESLFVLAVPANDTQPVPQTLAAGADTDLTPGVAAAGSTFQWQLNRVDISGATNATLALTNIGTTDAGQYDVVVTGPSGSPTETIDVTTVTVTVDAGLVNGSARGYVGANQDLVEGFAIGGQASKQLLLRGIGPALEQFGVVGALQLPKLTLFDAASASIASDLGWGNPPVTGTSSVPAAIVPATAETFDLVQAFALTPASADCALVATLPPGAYTIRLGGSGGSAGIGLAEVYSADSTPSAPRLTNLSALGTAGSGTQTLVAGFVVSGTTSETLLLRGVGPALAQYGVSGALQTPQLTLYDAFGNVVAVDSGLGPSVVNSGGLYYSAIVPSVGVEAATPQIMQSVGAFPLPAGSADCAMVVILPPGAYTLQVTGADGTSGVALAEVYDIP